MRRIALLIVLIGSLYAQSACAQISLFGSLTPASSITPTAAEGSVDLLIDADSYTPPWYRGRALPSPGSMVHAQAITHFTQKDGSNLPEADTVYTWRVNGQVQGNASGVGRSSAVLPSPWLFGSETVQVDARSLDDSIQGTASVTLASADPFVLLYRDDPLLGVEYFAAFGAQTSVNDPETTFAAIPYFAPSAQASSPDLTYNWRVNGITPTGTSSTESEITVNAAGMPGWATIDLNVTSRSDRLLNAIGSWSVQFPSGTTGGAFSQPTPNNPFNTQ